MTTTAHPGRRRTPAARTGLRILACLALALLLALNGPGGAAPALAQSSPLDEFIPLGFGGLDLGVERSALAGESLAPTRVIHVESMMEGEYDVRFYSRKGQDMTLNGAALDAVEYGFCDDFLCAVLVTATGEDNYRLLRDHYVATYGTDERTAFAYDTVWERLHRQESEDGITTDLWILCERQTDNCALARLIWQERISRATLDIGQQVDPD